MSIERLVGLFFVLLLHAVALWGLWQHRLLPVVPREALKLLVDLIAPPAPEKKEEPRRERRRLLPPKSKHIEKSDLRQIIAETPAASPTDYVASTPSPVPWQPVPRIEVQPTPLPVGPVALGSELAVSCAERPGPVYPAVSRRLGEEGIVVLRVELDESGHVATARVSSSSGYERLDDAAMSAVHVWRCTPARRDGQPVRAVALQPFKFVLQGN